MLTPKMSLRRNVVLKTYAAVVDALYSPNPFAHGILGSSPFPLHSPYFLLLSLRPPLFTPTYSASASTLH